MPGLIELKEQAKALRIPGSLIRANMNDADKLAALIESFEQGKQHGKKVSAKSKGKKEEVVKMAKPVARAKVEKRASVKAPAKKKPVAKSKPVAAKKSVAKRTVAKAAKTTSKAVKATAKKSSDAGRNVLGRVNYKRTTNWNPREGSATYIIFQSLKKHGGDRDAVYRELKKKAAKLFPKAADPDKMLTYRIARCDWDFALQTGQHVKSTNRVEYGTGGNGTKSKGRAKAAVKSARAAKATPAKRGRPKGSTNKAKTTTKAKPTVKKRKVRR